ncbi:hypothetical protein ACEWY4_003892 [Coilia grayii]|uniref:SCAN box domain-containing protein n=1 Tax=Coilia grayii TaxID=363190 RepID=A0ABD1KKW3_9TELE
MTTHQDLEDLVGLFSGLQTQEHPPQMEQLLRLLVEAQKAQQETTATLVEQQARANQLKEQELRQTQPKIKAGNFVAKLGVDDDEVVAYLHAFEATAAREGWPKAQWVGLLAPFLAGEALKAYQDVESTIGEDYDRLKEEIRSRYGLTKFSLAQHFHNWNFQSGISPRSQLHELARITKRWLAPDMNSAGEIVEMVIMDRYLRALPYEAKKVISQQKVTTAMQLVEAVEQYQAASDMLQTCTAFTERAINSHSLHG